MTTIDYILSFLLYGRDDATQLVGYTANQEEWHNYKVVILPQRESLADLYVPVLNKRLTTYRHEKTTIVEQDLVYNTFFLVSMAEELLTKERDCHGRFMADLSVMAQQNMLLIPVVDEYSRFLLKLLELPLPERGIKQINLTHDIDILTRYRSIRSLLGAIKRGECNAAFRACHNVLNDPAYTFPWISNIEQKFKATHPNTEILYFLKCGDSTGNDYPQYHNSHTDLPRLTEFLFNQGAKFGLHASYASADNPKLIKKEYMRLGNLLDKWHIPLQSANRTHFLRANSADYRRAIADAAIADDYTAAFADKCGFRLGTTRPVRYIDPRTTELTPLTLHPLTVMDCTLSDYMQLDEDEAFYTCQQLIEKTATHNGTLTLLFHNQLLTPQSYHRRLYTEILKELD
ncbi:MAG: hypothetical protein IJS05_05850 [Paludibacteraceae bacterium]|nr:hypothetical protein [Paludibacteraceae bacterium]